MRAAAPLSWAVSLIGLARIDAAMAVLPALAALRGTLALVLALLALATCLGRVWRPRLHDLPRPWMLFAVSAVVYLLVGWHYTSRLRVSGDEPHYLLMAQS